MSKTETDSQKSTNSGSDNTETTSLAHNEQYVPGVWIRGNEKTGFFTTIGNQVLTFPTATAEEQREIIEKTNLKLVIGVVNMMITAATQIHENAYHAALKRANNEKDQNKKTEQTQDDNQGDTRDTSDNHKF